MQYIGKSTPALRVVYIPLLFSSVELHAKAMNRLEDLSQVISPLDLVEIYLANTALETNLDFDFLKGFNPFFQDDPWVIEWEETINKEKQRRELQEKPLSDLDLKKLLNCRIFFNGVTLFFFETEAPQFDSLHAFCGEIIRQMALLKQVEEYQNLEVFTAFCRL